MNEALDKALHQPYGFQHEMVKDEWTPTVLHGKLVHESQNLSTAWKFIEEEEGDGEKKAQEPYAEPDHKRYVSSQELYHERLKSM